MNIITTSSDLRAFCDQIQDEPFLCVDTEFMRESTFYSQLCLIQVASPKYEAIIDSLADGLDLDPFIKLLNQANITKVMHAARQDLEIFYHIGAQVPAPLFDTQIAAMALGFGDSVGYMALVKGRLGRNLDKGARFTDWSRRPLTDKQLKYAIGDVTHLRDLYPAMVAELTERGRLSWVEAEMAGLLDENLYKFDPEKSWERLKIRNPKRDYLAILKGVAAWRERAAQSRNVPRRRVLKDEALYDIAQQRPQDINSLSRLRSLPRGFERSRDAKSILKAIGSSLAQAESYAPKIPKPVHMPSSIGPAADMLRTLLHLRAEYDDIAPRLIASHKDIEMIAAFGEKAEVPALSGWRREVFGEDALKMLRGELGLRLKGREVVAQPIHLDNQ